MSDSSNLPQLRIVDPDPDIGRVIANFSPSEYFLIGASSFGASAFTWLKVGNTVRTSAVRLSALVGFCGGVTLSYLAVKRQFEGKAPNDSLVAKYGILSPAELKDRYRRMQDPNYDLIDAPKRR